MSQPLQVALAPNLYLWGNCVLRVAALDPTTGADVSGVNVSNVTIEVELTSGDASAFGGSGPFMLVPGPGA